MKTILLFAFIALSAFSQEFEAFSTICTQTGVTSAKTTLSQATASAATKDKTYRAQLITAVIQSTTSGTVTIEISGTAPTTTSATVKSLNPGGRTARVAGWCASNVGSGTAISLPYTLTANVPLVLDMSNIWLLGLSSTKNVTINVAISSGNVTTAVYHKENF